MGLVTVQVDLIIEPQFREQFEIAHPTPAFSALLRALPVEYVGSRAKLKTMVEVVSACVAEAFQSQDLPLPPWRRKGAVLSKWNLVSHTSLSSCFCRLISARCYLGNSLSTFRLLLAFA